MSFAAIIMSRVNWLGTSWIFASASISTPNWNCDSSMVSTFVVAIIAHIGIFLGRDEFLARAQFAGGGSALHVLSWFVTTIIAIISFGRNKNVTRTFSTLTRTSSNTINIHRCRKRNTLSQVEVSNHLVDTHYFLRNYGESLRSCSSYIGVSIWIQV